jgi:hypothetical protein
MSENVGASTSRNPKALHGLYGDNFILPFPSFGKRNDPEINILLVKGK